MRTPMGAGGDGGGDTHTPVQSPDSLSSVTFAQILDLISEGPIYGPPSGDPAQSVYLNDVPLKNADGTYNVSVNQFDYRPGTIDQTYIPGFDSSSSETSVGVALTTSTPYTLVVSDMNTNAVVITLGVQSLSKTNSSNGDVTGYTVNYQIQVAVDNGAYSVVVDTAFNGKASSEYQRSHRISLSGAASQYSIRVVRITADSTDVYTSDKTSVVSYSLVIDGKLRYPYCALAALSVDAVQFSSVPTRSYDMKGLLISIPSNYNPDLRLYNGVWDGTFVQGWTNNPAWVFYDLVLNKRYGLGQWVDATMIDRYALYQIAQYCDVMVNDGKGGQEPRFTCNCYIQSRADAYKVLQDLASVFRGMAYWAAGSVVATCDMPQDPAYIYTQANVIGGQFRYVGSSLKTRYTCALVTWNNPDNGYKAEPEYVEDADGIARYGINKAQITAFGCTSRGQAQRVGQWSILTSRYETNTVTFSVGLDGTLCSPGQIIAIADPNRAAQRRGGRVSAATVTTSLTLDKVDPAMANGDSLTVIMPNGTNYKTYISGINGNTVSVNPPLAAVPVKGAVWISESAQVNAQLFRVLSIAEKDGITFEITATQYEPGKYAAIDNGAKIDVHSITGSTFTTQQPPSSVVVSQYVVVDQGTAKTNMTISWSPAPSAVSYGVQWQKDNGSWVDAGVTGATSLDVVGIYKGNYLARVRAVNSMGVSSVYQVSALTALTGKTGAPPTVATLTASTDKVFAVEVDWTFPAGAEDTKYTEVWYSHTNDFTTASQLGIYSYPTSKAVLLGMVAGYDLYFWARLVDTSGNVGPWFPDSAGPGVHGMSSMDATAILAYLTGQITATQLAQSLLTPIEAIPQMQQDISSTSTALATETQNRIDGDSALSSRIDTISAQYVAPEEAGDTGSYAGSTSSYAGLYTEQSARAEADLALAQRIEKTQALIYSNNNALFAAVQVETTARISADAAAASQLTTVQAQVNSNTAAVQTNAQAYADLNGVVSAMYTIKVQTTSNGKTYIAGIGLSSDSTNGSQVFVTADRFAVLETTAGNTFSPFVIQNGQAYINQAFIGNAWITNAMIANAAITNANIANAAISTAQIQNAAIQSAQIANASINQAHINGAIIGSAQIQNAAIQTAHIGTAQIDTLRLGANAVTTQASFEFSQSPGTYNYTGHGGIATVMLMSLAATSGGVCINGSTVLTCPANGGVSFALVTMNSGNNTVSNQGGGVAQNACRVVIFEAYR